MPFDLGDNAGCIGAQVGIREAALPGMENGHDLKMAVQRVIAYQGRVGRSCVGLGSWNPNYVWMSSSGFYGGFTSCEGLSDCVALHIRLPDGGEDWSTCAC